MIHSLRLILVLLSCVTVAHASAWAAATHEDPVVAAHEKAANAAHAAHDEAALEGAEHGAAEAEHGGGGVGLPQFDPSSFPSQVFWLAIAFGILYFVFSKKTLPDIGAVIGKREQHVATALESARAQKERAETLQREYETKLESARQDATSAFAVADKAIKDNAESEGKAFQKRAAEKIEKAEEAIEKAKAAAMEDMHALAAEIASKAAEKIIGVESDIDEAKTVVKSLKAKAA